MTRNNHIVIDLNKVAYAKHYYENQHAQRCRLRPNGPTAYGELFDPKGYQKGIAGQKESYAETNLEAAARLHILDVWFPVTRFQFANTHSIEYTGEKAQTMWKAWNEKIFNRNKQKKGY